MSAGEGGGGGGGGGGEILLVRRSLGVRSEGLIGAFWVAKRVLRGFEEDLAGGFGGGGGGEIEGLGAAGFRVLGRRRLAGS